MFSISSKKKGGGGKREGVKKRHHLKFKKSELRIDYIFYHHVKGLAFLGSSNHSKTAGRPYTNKMLMLSKNIIKRDLVAVNWLKRHPRLFPVLKIQFPNIWRKIILMRWKWMRHSITSLSHFIVSDCRSNT